MTSVAAGGAESDLGYRQPPHHRTTTQLDAAAVQLQTVSDSDDDAILRDLDRQIAHQRDFLKHLYDGPPRLRLHSPLPGGFTPRQSLLRVLGSGVSRERRASLPP